MDVMVQRCAGLDVHRDSVVATVRVPGSGRRRWDQQTQTFAATLAGLAELAAWLAAAGVTLVGMEATGVYWKTVFQALEDKFECWLLNAHHLRNVPGRKTDVKDSDWICQLVQHGLVRPSFVPPPEIRRLRDLTRLRKAQTNERGRTIQRLEKVLQDAGIKFSSVASRTYSKSARAILEALLSGVTDPDQLAELSKGKMRAKIPQLREALASRFQVEHHGIMVAQLLAHIDTLDVAIQNLSERIEFVLIPHAEIVELLCTIPGVQAHAAQVLIAECGLDMSLFPTVGHFASWAGACPGHNQSAGRRRSGRTRPGPRWLTDQLTECARAAVRTKETYLAAHFAQLRGRRGEPKAIGAIRHDLLVSLLPHRSRPGPIPRPRIRLATQTLLSRTPRPPPPTTARSPRICRHPRPSRRRTSRITHTTTEPGYRRRDTPPQLPCPHALTTWGIHTSTSMERSSPGHASVSSIPQVVGTRPIIDLVPRFLLDTRLWRELIDAGAIERLRLTARRVGSSVLVAPGVVYEMLRTKDRALRHRQVRAVTLQSWTRLMPEVFTECEDLQAVFRKRRPEWILSNPDLAAFHRLRADWGGGRGFWYRARQDPDSQARAVIALGADRLERARREAHEQRGRSSNLNYDSISSLKGWTSPPPKWEPGWEGDEVDTWRVVAASTWWAQLVTEPSRTHLEWLGPFLDVRRIAREQGSWNHLWGSEVDAYEVPREWLRWAVGLLQGTRRVTPGTPGDRQIAAYTYEADVFLTTDRTFADIINKVRMDAPERIASARPVEHGPDGANIVCSLLEDGR